MRSRCTIAAQTFWCRGGLEQRNGPRWLALGRAIVRGYSSRAGWTGWLLGRIMARWLVMWVAPSRWSPVLVDGPQSGYGRLARLLQVAAAKLVDGAQVIGAGMLRGLHDTRWPLIFALIGYWGVGLGIGAWLAFGLDWRGVGLWVGLASGLAAVAALMLGRWLLRDRPGLGAMAVRPG